jgi:hypothetical protein
LLTGGSLYGANGDTGVRRLDNSLTYKNKFEGGQVDVFKVC